MSEVLPVTIKTANGNIRVGTAVRTVDGFALTLGELSVGAAPVSSGSAPRPSRGPTPTVFPNYGRSKGQPIAGATPEDLNYYANGARRSIADPTKARWHESEAALLAAIEAELAKGGGAKEAPAPEPRPSFMQQTSFADPPPPGDDDIPF